MDLLDRLYQRLLRAAEQARPDPGAHAFTIGDVYQQLIPYRAVRSELGIWELAQYEHALLRLLAGERGYLAVRPAEVQEELIRELASTNPILGVYRDYAGIEVHVVALGEWPALREPARTVAPEPPPPGPRLEPVPPAAPVPAPGTGRASAPALCHRCHTALPEIADLRFCPACGADQVEVLCRGCGIPLRPDWNFCIRCGAPRPGREAAGRAW